MHTVYVISPPPLFYQLNKITIPQPLFNGPTSFIPREEVGEEVTLLVFKCPKKDTTRIVTLWENFLKAIFIKKCFVPKLKLFFVHTVNEPY